MPILLDVGARPDDRSFRQVADRAKSAFSDAGRDSGKAFSEHLTSGLKSADDAVRKSAETAQKAYDKAADAAGKVRAEEAKLTAARESGNTARIITQAESLERARRAETATTRAAATALRDLDSAQRTAANSGTLLSNLLGGISQGAAGTQLGVLAGHAENLTGRFSGMTTAAAAASVGIAGIAVGVGAASKALYDLGSQWDDLVDGITGRTGKMGDELDRIVDSVKQVGETTALPLSDIGNIAAGVSQSLHLTGDDLTRMTDQIAGLQQVTGQGVDTKALGKAFRLFGIDDVNEQVDALNGLLTMAQQTDTPINELIGTMQQAGKTAKQFGLDFSQTAGLLSVFEEAGVDAEKTSTGLSLALKSLAKGGQDPVSGLQQTVAEIQRLHDAGQETAAINLATSTFGKGYVDFLNAIESGDLDVKKLNDAVTALGDNNAIDKQKDATEDWVEQWQKLKNTFSSDLAPLAGGFFSMVNDWLTRTTQPLKDLVAGFKELQDTWNSPAYANGRPSFAGVPGAPGTPVTADSLPGLFGGGGASGVTLGDLLTGAQGTTVPGAPGAARAPSPLLNGLTYSGFQGGWNDRTPGSGSGPKLPGAPVLPYDTSLPAGFASLPQTSAIVSAEQSWMDARHTLAEKNARVLQLESDANAKADDIQKAKNDVINAQQAQQQAELRLVDARQSLFDKSNKQLKGFADQMGEIGAKLDNDFGISKGLPGLAENLFKFLANLGAAPIEGALNAIQRANPNEGSGLVGLLAATGSFGQQYTPGAIAAANASSSGSTSAGVPLVGGGGAYPGDAALLAGIPAGRYSQTQAADLTKGIGDCSSAVEDLVNILDGRPTAGRSMSTGNEAQWLTERGFLPGLGGPGDFRVGFNSGHTQATLPGGTPFNWGSDSAAANRGIGGTGADDPAFTAHYYRPMGGGYAPVAPGVGVSTTSLSGGGGTTPVFVTNWPGGGVGAGLPFGLGASAVPGGGVGGSPIVPSAGGPSASYPALSGADLTNPGLTPPVGAPGGGAGSLPGVGMPPQSAPLGLGMQPPAQGGPGLNVGGGALGMAEGAAALGADMLAPGSGAAVQMASQLINKTIEFGGKVAGIGVGGVMDFLSVGDNPKGAIGNSWFGKLAGGIAGAKPALPNMAGKPPPGLDKQPGQVGNSAVTTNNINVTNNRASEDGTGKDIQRHLEAMPARPGLHG